MSSTPSQVDKELKTMRVIEYQYVSDVHDDIEEAVNLAIKDGWQPIGGIAISNGYKLQAMVRYEEPKPIKVEGTHRAEIKTTGRTNLNKRTII